MRLLRRALSGVLLLAALVVVVGLYFVAYPNLPDYEAPKALRYLDQWSEKDRQTYYYTPQGTQVKSLEYAWFSALELPFSRAKLATPDYLARFGFLVDPAQKATALNPGNLPVGFARHEDDETGRAYLDVTCARAFSANRATPGRPGCDSPTATPIRSSTASGTPAAWRSSCSTYLGKSSRATRATPASRIS